MHRTTLEQTSAVDLLSALRSVVSLLSIGVEGESELCQRVVDSLRELGLRGAVMLRDGDPTTLTVRALTDGPPIVAQVERLSGLTAQGFQFDASRVDAYRAVLHSAEAVFLEDARDVLDELLPDAAREYLGLLRRAAQGAPTVFAPLLRAGRVVGVLTATSPKMTASDVPALQGFAAGVSVALENVRLRTNERFEATVRDCVRIVLRGALSDESVETTAERALEVLLDSTEHTRGAIITLFDPERGDVRRVLRRTRRGHDDPAFGETCSARAWRERMLREGVECIGCEQQGACGLRDALALPIADREHLYGVLCVDPGRADSTPSELGARLGPVANALGAVIARREAESARASEHERFLRAHRLEALGQLSGGVAHDFNNILTAVVMTSSLLRERLTDPDAEPDLDEIDLACQRGARLTRQLLMFGRRQVSSPRPILVSTLVSNMQKMLTRLVGEDITLRLETVDDPWPVMADSGSLEQALMNLVLNARDAMPEGGDITIRVTREPAGSPLAPDDTSEGVCLSVRDTGAGIDEATRARMFEPFFTTKSPDRGTGLGLAVVLGVVQESHGRIEVESAPGLGSTFKVWLPRVGRTSSDAPRVSAHPARRVSARLLVIDDDVSLAHNVARFLANAGHRPSKASTVAEARALAHGCGLDAFDALVSDVILPDGNGVAFAAELRARRPAMPVLLMSGYLDDRSHPDEIRARGYAFLSKPFRPDDLLTRIDELLAAPQASA